MSTNEMKKEKNNPVCKCGKFKETNNTLMCWRCWRECKEDSITKKIWKQKKQS